MKKIHVLLLIALFGISQAQNLKMGFNQMPPEKRKEIINEMSPEERKKLLKDFCEDMMVNELNIPEENEKEFRELYCEYLDKQKEIKSRFQDIQNYSEMSDDEAKQKLNQSFDVAQQLLNNRREYAGKFMKICRPQQVLKMYQTEGLIRNKMMERKEMKNTIRKKDKNPKN